MRGLVSERPRRGWAAGRLRLAASAGVLLIGVSGGSGAAVADSPRELVYEVKHSVFGDIGTYSNLIETSGAVITIKTAAHFLVKALGVGLHREDAQRVEQWQGDRLIFFHGITTKNGDTTEIRAGQRQAR